MILSTTVPKLAVTAVPPGEESADRRDARLSNTTQTPHEPALLLRHGVGTLALRHAGQIDSSALAPAPRACISAGIRNANADTPAPAAHAFAAPRGALSPPQAAGLDKAHTTTLATAGLAVLE